MEKLLEITLLILMILNQTNAQDCEDDCSNITEKEDDVETTTVPPNSAKTCDVSIELRTECSGMAEDECVGVYNCCWDGDAVSTKHKCFQKGITTFTVPTIQRPTPDVVTTEIPPTAEVEAATTKETQADQPTTDIPSIPEETSTAVAQNDDPVDPVVTDAAKDVDVPSSTVMPTTETDVDVIDIATTTGQPATTSNSESVPSEDETDDPFKLVISSVLVDPFLMEKENLTDDIQGNDRYEGFIKDYLDILATRMDMKYSLLVRKNFGKKVAGDWTGVIGDVVHKNASFAAAPLIVTVEREAVVDFTWSVLDFEAVFVMLRRHPKQTPKIESFEDLVSQQREESDNKVLFGITRGSSLAKEMQTSNNPLIKEAWGMIQKSSYLIKDTTNQGFLRARRDGQYAFLTDEQTAEYVLREEPCQLEMIKAGFFKRRFAFAVPNQSPLGDKLNKEILMIDASGKKQEIYDKWWGENQCASAASVIKASILLVVFCLHSLLP